MEHLPGSVPTGRTSEAAGPTRTAVIVVGRFPTATVGPELGIPSLRIGFYVRAFLWASVLSRGADSMWLTTSTVGPFIVYRSRDRLYNYYDEYGSTVAYTGTDPLGTGPVFSHGLSPTPAIYHFGLGAFRL